MEQNDWNSNSLGETYTLEAIAEEWDIPQRTLLRAVWGGQLAVCGRGPRGWLVSLEALGEWMVEARAH